MIVLSNRVLPRGWAVLVAVIFVGLVSASPIFGAEALNYRYQLDGNQTLDYWFSQEGLKLDFKDENSGYTILQPTGEQAIVMIVHGKKEAVKLDRAFMERMMARMEQMRKKLRNLPPRQRKMMEKSMGGMMEGLSRENVSPPSVINKTPTEWRNRSAVRGIVEAEGDTVGTVLLLDEPPLALTEAEQNSVRNFQELMEKLLNVTGTVAESMGSDVLSGNQSFHLFGDRLFRLAEFQSTETSLRLTDWGRRDVPNGFFTVPSDYTVKTPGESMGATPGRSRR